MNESSTTNRETGAEPSATDRDTGETRSAADRGPVAEPSTMALSDGRTLGYAEYGSPDGRPVFCFHGVPGSRHMWSLFDDAARERGVRLVAPERPGFGASTFQRRRRLLDWPADVGALADHLGIDRFAVVGFSAGGPHAAACARELGERVGRVVLAGAVAPPECSDRARPFNHWALTALRHVPGFSLAAFGTAAWLATHARPAFREAIAGGAARPDRALLDTPAGDVVVDDAAEAFRNGSRGPAFDLPLVGNDWAFDVRTIDRPVTMWHGRADGTVSIEMARAFADLLPDVDLRVTDDAHYSVLANNREAVLDSALDAPAAWSGRDRASVD
jgi:pimeloyl-ACP methyl ester carboxylesterase